jgi:diphthine-ammonia ligase
MVAAGLHSIIIKVACLGLNEKHLGKSIATIEPIMLRLAERYGCNVCGEGGEFETLTLDGPMFPQGSIQMLVRTDSSAAAGSSSMLW